MPEELSLSDMTVGQTHTLVVKYSVDGTLTNVADYDELSFTSDKGSVAVADDSGTITAKAAGTCAVTVSVTNSTTGLKLSDVINVTVKST